MRLNHLLLVVIFALALAGCKSGTSVVGHYKGAAVGEAATGAAAGLAQGMAASMNLDLKADNTFQMTMIFPMTGTWSQSGDTVNLKPEKVLGMDAGKDSANSKPIVFKVSSDGQTLTPVDTSGKSANPFVFKRG